MNAVSWFLFFYYLITNFIAIMFTVRDNVAKINDRKRVPEAVLMVLAVLSGGIGMFLTMLISHHMTDKRKYMIGLPVVFIVEFLILLILKLSGVF